MATSKLFSNFGDSVALRVEGMKCRFSKLRILFANLEVIVRDKKCSLYFNPWYFTGSYGILVQLCTKSSPIV
jgi:hypothetical protein